MRKNNDEINNNAHKIILDFKKTNSQQLKFITNLKQRKINENVVNEILIEYSNNDIDDIVVDKMQFLINQRSIFYSMSQNRSQINEINKLLRIFRSKLEIENNQNIDLNVKKQIKIVSFT